jgi:dUTPase
LAAQTLQCLGYCSKEDWNIDDTGKQISHNFNIQLLPTTTTKPTRGTLDLIGYTLYLDSQLPAIIPAGTIMPLPTGIANECPTGSYARIAPCSRLTIKNNLTTMAGITDPDYC